MLNLEQTRPFFCDFTKGKEILLKENITNAMKDPKDAEAKDHKEAFAVKIKEWFKEVTGNALLTKKSLHAKPFEVQAFKVHLSSINSLVDLNCLMLHLKHESRWKSQPRFTILNTPPPHLSAR